MLIQEIQKFNITLDDKNEFKGMSDVEIAEFVLGTSDIEYKSLKSYGFKIKKNQKKSKKHFFIEAVMTSESIAVC